MKVMLAALAALTLAPAALAAPPGWGVIENLTYVASGSTPLQLSFVSEPIVYTPDIEGLPPGTNARARLQVTGPPSSVGRAIQIKAAQTCDDQEFDRSSSRTYMFVARPGQVVALPAAALKQAPQRGMVSTADIVCVWAFKISTPAGAKHAVTVALSAYPAFADPTYGVLVAGTGPNGTYDAESCTIRLTAAGTTQRACKPL